MRRQNEIAKELGISKSYLSMILNGQRKCPDKLQSALSMFTNVHRIKLNGAWKAGTLPPELLPPNRIYSSLKNWLCKGDAFPLYTTLDRTIWLLYYR